MPHAQEILETQWLQRQSNIHHQLEARSTSLTEELTANMEVTIEGKKQALQQAAEEYLRNFEAELNASTTDEVERIKNKAKSIVQQAKDEDEQRILQSVVRTSKATKPSPLNISKLRKKKKKHTILDLTTPPPGAEPSDNHTDMETDTDSTPTTPICRSTAPSPAPLPRDAPETVPMTVADPETIPHWARTPSPNEKTPHAPSFTITNPTPAPTTITQAPAAPPINPELSAIMSMLSGIRTELMDQIGKVNARIDLASGPQTIADHITWNSDNMAAWEHPGYVDPAHDTDMEAIAEENAAREVERLHQERAFRALHHRFVAEKRVTPISDDNDVYLEKWYQVCSDLTKSMNWDALNIPMEADETIINAWRRAECLLNEEEYNFSTSTIFERITGTKPNLSSPKGRAQFTTFTTAYNDFCATENFPTWEGFPESSDCFFKFYLSHSPAQPAPDRPATTTTMTTKPKSVRFTSAPPIETLPAQPTSSPEDFPALQAPQKAPISYASAASSFIPVTRRRRGKQAAPTPQTPASAPTSTTKPGPKPTKPTKPPLPDALKTTKHTIILDHTNPNTKTLYSLNAGELTLGLQRHLKTVKAPLVLLAGAWSTAPFYKNFILTFSGVVPFTDITKYNSVLFGPFGPNCRAAPTAGYQSILISGVRLQRDTNGKLASPKMLFDELCQNPVFVGHLPLAAPQWLFNPEKLLESDKQASSITFSFHDPTGKGLELMKRSCVGMFGKLVTIRSWEARPILSQCTRCLQLGHTVDRCRRHKDLVVCSKCGGAHEDALHHFNCPRSDRHKGRGCDCPPSCFLCIAQGNHKTAQGHTLTSVTCPIRKHFRTPSDDPTTPNRARSVTIPPTPATATPMNVLTSDDIRQLSAEGVSTEAITRLLVPPEVINLASMPAPMST